jgi:hypothetical protein
MRVLRSLALVATLLGCSDGPYVIGELGPSAAAYCPAGQDCEGRLELRFGVAGTAAWGDRFVAGRVARAPALLLRGEDATAAGWPARTGGVLVPEGETRIARRGPFTDATRTTEGRFASEGAIVRLGTGELAIELVLQGARTTRVLETDDIVIDFDDEGRLIFGVEGATTVTNPLATRTYYHVLFVVRPTGTRAYVNGAPLDGPGATVPAGDRAVRIDGSIAWLAMVPIADGELDERAVRERFARLTGVSPTVAGGDPVPLAGGRPSVAFTDLVQDGARRLHRVGERWPRIACRPAETDVVCGYLAEDVAHRGVPLELGAWSIEGSATAIEWAEIPGVRVTSTTTLRASHDGDDARRVLSVWARGSGELELAIEGVGRARCVPSTGVIAVLEGVVTATREDFGDGWTRCVLGTEVAPAGPVEVSMIATELELAGPQVDTNRLTASSLVIEDRELDALAYAGPGNVSIEGAVNARVLVRGEELHDRSVLGLDGGGPENAARVYAETRDGTVVFAGFVGGAIAWNAHAVESVLDVVSRVEARWGLDEASVTVGATVETSPVSAALPSIDAITIGDAHGSGALNGLVVELTLAPR